MLHATRHSAYHGVNDGFLVVLPDVVIEEDVLDGRVEGVHPEGLPPHQGARVLGPPVGRRRRGGGRRREIGRKWERSVEDMRGEEIRGQEGRREREGL